MPDTSQQLHPSRQVERIREILVGRQMQTVEQRLEQLEGALQPMPVESNPGLFETHLSQIKKESEEALTCLRDEIDADRLRQLEETRRLAQQIQSIARSRSESTGDARRALQQDMGNWFSSWQAGLQQHLQEREDYLIRELRTELDKIRSTLHEKVSKRQQPNPDVAEIQAAFEHLADTTRAIANSLQPAKPFGGQS